MSLADRLQREWWRPRLGWVSAMLLPSSWLYAAVTGFHRACYRVGWRRAPSLPVPVVVVGNLIVGGAGKTPVVIALVQSLRDAGWTPGVVSRGYGRRGDTTMAVTPRSGAADVGDEPLMIHLRTLVPVVVGRDRVAAVLALCAAHPRVDVIVSDDGLQHLALARQLQVLVFDERGVGNGRLLPAGPLRQPLPPMLPPATLALYNAPQATTPLPGALVRRRLGGAVSLADWWRNEPATATTLHALRDRSASAPMLAVAGLADPERFFRMLETAGLRIERLPMPDHHAFDVLPWPHDREVLITEKDAVKLPPGASGTGHVWVVTLDLRLPRDFLAEARRILRPITFA